MEALLEAVFEGIAELFFSILPRRLQVGCATLIGLGFVALIGHAIWHAFLT